MAWTQEQYDKLQEAIGQGALLVKYGDKEVRYRSLDEMIRILNMMGVSLGIVTKNRDTVASYYNDINPGCSDDDSRWIR